MPPLSINDLINQSINPAAFAQPSPLADHAIEQFKRQQRPIIENTFALQGLANSPALGEALASGLGNAMPQFILADMQNQRAGQQIASDLLLGSGQLGLGGRQLGQQAAVSAADIINQQQQRQLQSALGVGNLLTQFGAGVTLPAQQQQTDLAQAGISGILNTGQQQQQTEQAKYAAATAERARLQALAQQGAFGVTGGAGLTPLIGQTTTTGK